MSEGVRQFYKNTKFTTLGESLKFKNVAYTLSNYINKTVVMNMRSFFFSGQYQILCRYDSLVVLWLSTVNTEPQYSAHAKV